MNATTTPPQGAPTPHDVPVAAGDVTKSDVTSGRGWLRHVSTVTQHRSVGCWVDDRRSL